MAVFEVSIHSSLNSISGIVLIVIGIIILLRNINNRLNQLFAVFFFGIATFEIFDGFTVAFRSEPNLNILNGFHYVALIGLILGLVSAFIAINVLNFGKTDTFMLRKMAPLAVLTLVVITGALLGDYIPGSTWHVAHQHYHVKIDRTIIGLLSITGFILIATIINLLLLYKVYKQVEGETRSKLARLMTGFMLIMAVVITFDLSFSITELTNLITSSDVLHALLHMVLFAGEIFVLSSFWSPIGTAEPSVKEIPA